MTTEQPSDSRRVRREKPEPDQQVLLGRLPPHDVAAEQGVLGCILLDPRQCMDLCIAELKDAGKEAFYDLRHQGLYSAMIELQEKGIAIDLITLQKTLASKQILEQVGGLPYIATLPDAAPSAANLPYYLEIVRGKYLLRRVVQTCTEVIGKVFDSEVEPNTILDDAERDVLAIRQFSTVATRKTMVEAVTRAIAVIEGFHTRKGGLLGLSSGFIDYDKLTGGLVPSELVLLAGRPGTGKTSLCMNIAEHVALDLKQPVGVFSMEMTMESLVMRMMCSRAKVNMRNVRDGFLADRDFPKLTMTAGHLSKAPFHIEDISSMTIQQLRAMARRMKAQHDIALLVVDYIQLLHATLNGKRIDNRVREVGEVSQGLKGLAKELGIPVIALCQMNRAYDKAQRRPLLSDLRESGDLEQVADVVAFLHRVEEENEDPHQQVCPTDLIVAKQRNGPTGDIRLTFLKAYTRYENAAKVVMDVEAHVEPELPYSRE